MTAEEIRTNLEHGYNNGWTPEDAVRNRALPDTQTPGVWVEFIEVQFPDGSNELCIRTGVPVKNGPGKKYEVVSK